MSRPYVAGQYRQDANLLEMCQIAKGVEVVDARDVESVFLQPKLFIRRGVVVLESQVLVMESSALCVWECGKHLTYTYLVHMIVVCFVLLLKNLFLRVELL